VNPAPPAGGMLRLEKPPGPTSRDVVDDVVGALGVKRVGHAGTLDPFAQGLLLVVWGRATGLVPYLQRYPKTYEVEAEFGRTTDTQDGTGVTLAVRDASGLDAAGVRDALPAFRGTVRQVPPMYSAVKQAGRRLYEHARAGREVAREPRERTVFTFDLTEFSSPRARFRVTCEGGTYVRTLVHDLGAALGTGACVLRLERTAVGPHRLEGALAADRLRAPDRAAILAHAVAPAAALPDWPEIRIQDPAEAREVVCGSWRDAAGRAAGEGEYRVTGPEGNLLAVVRGGRPVRLLRVFGGPEGD